MAVWMSGKSDFLWWYVLKRDSLHDVPQLGKIAGNVQDRRWLPHRDGPEQARTHIPNDDDGQTKWNQLKF